MLVATELATITDEEKGLLEITPKGEEVLQTVNWVTVIEKLGPFPMPEMAYFWIAKLKAKQVQMEYNTNLPALLQEEITKLQQTYPEAIAMGGYAPISADWGRIVFESSNGKRLVFLYNDNRHLAGNYMSLEGIQLQKDGNTQSLEALMQPHQPGFNMKSYLDQKMKENKGPKLAFQALIKEFLLRDII